MFHTVTKQKVRTYELNEVLDVIVSPTLRSQECQALKFLVMQETVIVHHFLVFDLILMKIFRYTIADLLFGLENERIKKANKMNNLFPSFTGGWGVFRVNIPTFANLPSVLQKSCCVLVLYK